MSTTFAYVTTLIYDNFPGIKADVRIHDERPTLLIRAPNNPKGHFYLVSAEVDTKNGGRSVKMGNHRMFGTKNLGAPDSDNQIEYEAVAEGADSWRLTPVKDLPNGECGSPCSKCTILSSILGGERGADRQVLRSRLPGAPVQSTSVGAGFNR